MLLNGGEYNGTRILSHNTVRMMTMNQIGELKVGDGNFGLGFSIVAEEASRLFPGGPELMDGEAHFHQVLIDPKEKMMVLLYPQMWISKIEEIDKGFIPLVYQGTDD